MKVKALLSMVILLFVGLSLSSCGEAKKGFDAKPTENVKSDNSSSNTQVDPNISGKHQVNPEDLKSDDDVLEVKERVFLAQINDIYSNFQDYEKKTIIVEGMFSHFKSSDEQNDIPVVYRRGPGCCGNDGWGGFLLKYEGALPKENDWIKVIGKPLLEKTEKGYYNLYLKVESIEVLSKRGAEYVKQ